MHDPSLYLLPNLAVSMLPLLLPSQPQLSALKGGGVSILPSQTLPPGNVKKSTARRAAASPPDEPRQDTQGAPNTGYLQSTSSTASALTLQAFFLGLLSELKAAIEQVAVSEFNSWLVSRFGH
jgi:hypothetical protein